MTFDDYLDKAARTINPALNYDEMIMCSGLGLPGETGEIADIVKKWQFQGHDLDREKVMDEAGDVLWYLAQLAMGLGVSLSDIAARNIAKLQARYPDGFAAERSINREG